MGLLDSWANDEDSELWDPASDAEDGDGDRTKQVASVVTEADYKTRAGEIYERYAKQFRKRFKWLRPSVFEDARLSGSP